MKNYRELYENDDNLEMSEDLVDLYHACEFTVDHLGANVSDWAETEEDVNNVLDTINSWLYVAIKTESPETEDEADEIANDVFEFWCAH